MQNRGWSYAAGQQWARMSWSSRLYACVSAAIFFLVVCGALAMAFRKASPPPPVVASNRPVQVAAELIPKPKAPEPPKSIDPNAVPESWQEFRASARKDDIALVAQIEKNDWWKNCVAWGAEARKKVQTRKMWALQANLRDSSTINGLDLGGVRGKVPEIGMTTCGAFAVMGLPEDVNRTKTVGSERVQFVWRTPRVYAYTQTSTGNGNALIHSVQY